MTTIHLETRTFRLRLPALVVGRRIGTSLVVQVTERVELRLERRVSRGAERRAAYARYQARLDEHRTRALAHRTGGCL